MARNTIFIYVVTTSRNLGNHIARAFGLVHNGRRFSSAFKISHLTAPILPSMFVVCTRKAKKLNCRKDGDLSNAGVARAKCHPLRFLLKAQLKGRLKLSDAERATLGEIGHRLGRQVLGEVANVARPDTILAWYRKLVARKFDGSKARRSPGRPRIKPRGRAADRSHGQGEP